MTERRLIVYVMFIIVLLFIIYVSFVFISCKTGQALPWNLSSRWGELVLQEFAAQAEAEAVRGIPVTSFMAGLWFWLAQQ